MRSHWRPAACGARRATWRSRRRLRWPRRASRSAACDNNRSIRCGTGGHSRGAARRAGRTHRPSRPAPGSETSGTECRTNGKPGHGPQRHRRLHQGRRDQKLHGRRGCARASEIDRQPQACPARGAARRAPRAADHAQARADRDRRCVLRAVRAHRGGRQQRRAARHRHAGHTARPPAGHQLRRLCHPLVRLDHLGVPRAAPRHQRRARGDRQGRRHDRGRLRPRRSVRPDARVDADRPPTEHGHADRLRDAGVPRDAWLAAAHRGARRARPRAVHAGLAQPDLDARPRRFDLRVRPAGSLREQQLRRRDVRDAREHRHRADHRLHDRRRAREGKARPRAARVVDAPARGPRGQSGAREAAAAAVAVHRSPRARAESAALDLAMTITLGDIDVFAHTYLLPFGMRILLALAIFIVGRWVARAILRLFDKVMQRSDVDISLRKFLTDVAYAVLLVGTVIAALDTAGVKTTAVVAVLGAAGLAIGLALQGALSNFAAGVMLIVLRPYKVGDQVTIGKYLGRVAAIRVFQTILITADNREITIPNGQIIAAPIENMTVLGRRRVDLVVSVNHPADLPQVRDLLGKAIAADDRIETTPKPTIEIAEITDATTKLYLRTWTKCDDYAGVATTAIEKIKNAMEAAQVKFSVAMQVPS